MVNGHRTKFLTPVWNICTLSDYFTSCLVGYSNADLLFCFVQYFLFLFFFFGADIECRQDFFFLKFLEKLNIICIHFCWQLTGLYIVAFRADYLVQFFHCCIALVCDGKISFFQEACLCIVDCANSGNRTKYCNLSRCVLVFTFIWWVYNMFLHLQKFFLQEHMVFPSCVMVCEV